MSNVERKEEPMEEEISLFDAIGNGDLKKVQSIKDIKLFLYVNKGLGSPLFAACSTERTEIVKLLLSTKGVEVNYGYLKSALYGACETGNLEIVKMLLEIPGISLNKGSALSRACMFGHLEIVKILMEMPSIDVNKDVSKFNKFSKMWK
ncbi:predicted protein [Naegleria gruberi]|uniref:Predicted protein n=1 Tax=Naegleria gruberi TaxID=5762 RepID=D2W116_NAEGR|nr:uncharacterized protein NAEGRDRAFT_75055 [Naegleria gruberi]EFC37280.1 predicted protein [Naegleria gruberi]|eukprot:XP_002670024.1 predicted protein [Naegleria gruberi strain NEG-M]